MPKLFNDCRHLFFDFEASNTFFFLKNRQINKRSFLFFLFFETFFVKDSDHVKEGFEGSGKRIPLRSRR